MSQATLKIRFQVPQAAADQLAAGLTVIEDLVFDRTAPAAEAFATDQGRDRADPTLPIDCALYVADASAARHATALIEAIAELAGFDPPAISTDAIPAQDWVQLTQDNLPPVVVGRFCLRGSHSPPTRDLVDLQIDAGLAFGTGHHETTRGCLHFYDALLTEGMTPQRVLDMGCGSGVLAMAAAKTSTAQIVGIEQDGDSLAVAEANLAVNALAGRVRYILGAHPDLGGGDYDLIFANILAGPLIDLAPGLSQVATPTAHLLLAGLLLEQESAVLSTYTALGWHLRQRTHDGQWSLLWLQRS